MKKIFILLCITLLVFVGCKEIDTESESVVKYERILNDVTLSKTEKCDALVNCFTEKYNIKTALSVSVQNPDFSFCKNYGLVSLTNKNGCTSQTLHYVYSITKTVTSALTLTLVEKDVLNLDSSIDDYLPELFDEKKSNAKVLSLYINKDATLKELLNHTSGISDFAQNLKLYNTGNAIFTETWLPEYILDYIESPKEKRGTYIYSSTNYVLLGLIIQKVTGKSINTLFDEYFYKPLVLNNIYLSPQDDIDYSLVAHPHVYPNTDFNLTGDGVTPIDFVTIMKPMVSLIGKASWTSGGCVSNSSTICKWGYELYSEKGSAVSEYVRNLLYSSIVNVNEDNSDVYGFGIRKVFYKDYEFVGSYGRSVGSENLLFYNKNYDTSFCILSNCNMKSDNSPNIDELLFWLFECVKS